jgi:hypothetical protein
VIAGIDRDRNPVESGGVELTPLIWVALLPLNRLVTRQVEARTRPDGMTPGG